MQGMTIDSEQHVTAYFGPVKGFGYRVEGASRQVFRLREPILVVMRAMLTQLHESTELSLHSAWATNARAPFFGRSKKWMRVVRGYIWKSRFNCDPHLCVEQKLG